MATPEEYVRCPKGAPTSTGKTLLDAPAKINLGLSIVGRDPEGYHHLESLFWPLDLCDSIFLDWNSEHPSHSMAWAQNSVANQQPLPQESDNLITRLARFTPKSFSTMTEKRIPIGSGLGGGSADVGTLLRYLESAGELPREKTKEIASHLGSDIPFFLDPRPSWVQGRGEQITPLTLSPGWAESLCFFLVFPSFGISTGEIFSAYREASPPLSPRKNFDPTTPLSRAGFVSYLLQAKNDLEGIATHKFPVLQEVLDTLRNTPCLHAAMSGSGSTCFAIYDTVQTQLLKELSGIFRRNDCRSLIAKLYRAS